MNAADRLAQRGADTFAYDPLGRMTSSTVSSVVRSYAYNGDGLLNSRTESAATTSFLWDAAAAPAPLLGAGSDRLVHGLGPLYLVRADSSTLTLVRDGLGSVRGEGTDAGGVARTLRYSAYGAIQQSNPTGAAPTLLGFTGELQDPSGLLYLRARWYDVASGRLLTRDSYAGAAVQPASLNWYLYAAANPANYIDPTGMFCVGLGPSVTGAIGALLLGAAATGGGGVGACVDPQAGLTVGALVQGGGFIGAPFASIAFPNGTGTPALGVASGNATLGRYVGGGIGFFASNARRIGDLRTRSTPMRSIRPGDLRPLREAVTRGR